jgi:O-antigen/teichoic acid export membrane protein
LIQLFKKSLTNLFHLGAVQATNVLLQLVLIPLVISRVGIEANGYVLTALSLSGFIGIIINYASNQTGPMEVKLSMMDVKKSPSSMADIFFIRLVFFIIFVTISFILYANHFAFSVFLIGIIPLLFAEVLNPYIFYLGSEKLQYYNIANLLSRLLSLFLVYQGLKSAADAPFVNAYVGIAQSLGFILLWVQLYRNKNNKIGSITLSGIRLVLKNNMPLTIANMVVHLQQSIFLFGLGLTANPLVLGAYAIADKLIWGARMILIAFSNAIYPTAIETHHKGHSEWIIFRKNVNQILAFFLIIAGLVLFFMAPYFAGWLSKSSDITLLTNFIRWISPVPLVVGMNALNVMELLMKNEFTLQLKLNIYIFLFSIVLTMFFLFVAPSSLSILYLLFLESICLIIYEKNRSNSR